MNKNTKANQQELIIGLDLGIASIGYAVYRAGNLLDLGVREFPIATNDKNTIPKNVKRRTNRLTRRRIQRLSARKNKLRNYLVKLGLLPKDLLKAEHPDKILNAIGDPYKLAALALDKELKPHELGVVMQHSAARRGFQSNAKTLLGDLIDDSRVIKYMEQLGDDSCSVPKESKESKESKYLKEITGLRNKLNASAYRTLREYFLNSGMENKRNRSHTKASDYLRTERDMWKQDLDAVLAKQQEFHSCLTDDVVAAIMKIIFYQRPIKFKKDRGVGACSYVPRYKRAKKARLVIQRVRYLQDINNFKFVDTNTGEIIVLNEGQRNTLIALFEKSEKITADDINKCLGVNLKLTNLYETKNLMGNTTAAKILKVFPAWEDYNVVEQEVLVEALLTIASKKALLKRLETGLGIPFDNAIALCLIDLEPEYAHISNKAASVLYPLLKTGMSYSTAREEVGYGNKGVNKNKTVDLLPQPEKTNNPIVDRALSESRKLVNALIKKHGKPDVVRVEMARDLLKNTKRHAAQEKKNKQNKIENEKASEAFNKVQMSINRGGHCNHEDKIKYRLWKTQGMVCMYSGATIALKDVFTGKVEVDHIIPKSRYSDDSFNNKVLCFAAENQNKGNQTPIEAFGNDKTKWAGILKRIKSSKFSRFKASKFSMKGDVAGNFSASALNDTRYICKNMEVFLKLLGCKVTMVKGQATAIMRRALDVNVILGTKGKNRNDARHHAVDAAVIAMIPPNLHKLIAQQTDNLSVSLPYPDFKKDLMDAIEKVIPSRKVHKKLNGELHEDTGLRVKETGTNKKRKIYQTSARVLLDKDFTTKKCKKIVDAKVRALVENQLNEHKGNSKTAFIDFDIKHVRINICEEVTQAELDKCYIKTTNKEGGLNYKKLGNIHHVVFYKNTKGENKAVATYLLEARQRMQAGENVIQFNAADDVLMVLYKKSLVSLMQDGTRQYFYVTGINGKGGLTLKNALKNDATVLLNKSVNTLMKLELNHHEIDILGNITDAKTNN